MNVDLGIANIQIANALVQYATSDITTSDGTFIRAGMREKGDFSLYGLTSSVDFAMNTDGVRLNATLDFTAVRALRAARLAAAFGESNSQS